MTYIHRASERDLKRNISNVFVYLVRERESILWGNIVCKFVIHIYNTMGVHMLCICIRRTSQGESPPSRHGGKKSHFKDILGNLGLFGPETNCNPNFRFSLN